MFWTCFGHVLDMFWTCLGYVWDMFWTCFGGEKSEKFKVPKIENRHRESDNRLKIHVLVWLILQKIGFHEKCVLL